MLTLNVQVPEKRDATAIATLRDGPKIITRDYAAASTTPAIAALNANPTCDPLRLSGHPPLGRYRLLDHRPAQREQAKEYGAYLLLFEPESGPALDAESFGRLGLLVYGGPTGRGKSMRPTQGGLRLSNKMLHTVVSRLQPGVALTLELVPLRPRSWWQIWRPKVPTHPLCDRMLKPLKPPLDELSVLETMLRTAVRRPRPAASARDDTRSETDHHSDRSSSSSETFHGKGGELGGAGASGSWRDAAGTARGVDSAGRIVSAAAAVGAVGARPAMTAGASAQHANAGANSGAADAADATSNSGGSDADSGSSPNTSTGTAY